jgi:hypothetical protein
MPVKLILLEFFNEEHQGQVAVYGNHIKIDLFDSRDNNNYLKNVMSYSHLQMERGLDAIQESLNAVLIVRAATKLQTSPKLESHKAKEVELSAAKEKAEKAQAKASTTVSLAYNMFNPFNRTKPKPNGIASQLTCTKKIPGQGSMVQSTQDHACRSVHPCCSLLDCIEVHKLTLFTCDAVEKQKSYIMEIE